MGVSSAGAVNPIYGKSKSPLPTEDPDKYFGRKQRRKARKELTDEGNIRGPTPSKR